MTMEREMAESCLGCKLIRKEDKPKPEPKPEPEPKDKLPDIRFY